MYVYTTAPPQPARVLGTLPEIDPPAATMTNAVRFALILAAGAGAYVLYRKATGKSLTPNFITPWPGIGPIFSYSSGMGPAYSLTPFIV
jgi:hypothetical protein